MRVWLLTRTTGEPDWVESSCGVDVGISELKVGQLTKPVTVTAAHYLPPRTLRMHKALLHRSGLRPGLNPGAYVSGRRIILGPLVGVLVRNRSDVLSCSQARKLLTANETVGCLLYFFQPEDVHLPTGQVSALAFSPSPSWECRAMPLPDVIYDQTKQCAPELRQQLLRAGVRPVNQAVSVDGVALLTSVFEPGEYHPGWPTVGEVTVLMQRDDQGLWHITCHPALQPKGAISEFCHRAVYELERQIGCLGEVELKLTLAATGRCYIDSVQFIPDKRVLDERAFRLPLLFSRRLAGFPLNDE